MQSLFNRFGRFRTEQTRHFFALTIKNEDSWMPRNAIQLNNLRAIADVSIDSLDCDLLTILLAYPIHDGSHLGSRDSAISVNENQRWFICCNQWGRGIIATGYQKQAKSGKKEK